MSFRALVFSAAVAAVLLSRPVAAQETHTITPVFPDRFSTLITSASDEVKDTMGKTETSRIETVLRSDIERSGTGYTGRYTLVAIGMEMPEVAAQSGLKPEAFQEVLRSVLDGFTGITAVVSLDDGLNPVRVENLEEVKAQIRGKTSTAKTGSAKVAEAFIASLAPESAARYLRRGSEYHAYFNRPLVVGQTLTIQGEPMTFMNGTLKTSGNLTLTEWQEGKVAKFTYVMAPGEADIREFLNGLIKGLAGVADIPDDPEQREVLNRMASEMQVSMKMTCAVEVNLVTYVESHADCRTDMRIEIDLKKILPPEALAKSPEIKKMPPIVISSLSHTVTDSALVK